MTFNEKLIKLRKMKGLTQDEFAAAVSVSRQAVYKWESGQSYPEVPKLLLIKELFGISIDDLLDEAFEVVVPEVKRKRISKKAKAEIQAEVAKEQKPAEPVEEQKPIEVVAQVAEEAPAEEKPVEEVAEEAPVEEKPVEEVAEEAAEEKPAEEVAEEAPVEEKPLEEVAEEAPVEEKPVEEVAEEKPVEEEKQIKPEEIPIEISPDRDPDPFDEKVNEEPKKKRGLFSRLFRR